MKEPKAKPASNSAAKVKGKPSKDPKQIPEKAIRKTKEAVTKASREAKETLRQQSSPKSDAEESPEQYAESRIEQSTEYAVDRLKPSARGTRSRPDSERMARQKPDERFTGRDTMASSEPRQRTAEQPQPRTEKIPTWEEPSFEPEKQRFRTETNIRSIREKPQSHPSEPVREAEPKASSTVREADVMPIREPKTASPLRQTEAVQIPEPERNLAIRETYRTSAPREREPFSRLEAHNPTAREPLRVEADEPVRLNVREYQVEKLRKPEKASPIEPKEPEPRLESIGPSDAPVIKEARTEPLRSDVIHERMDSTSFREPQREIKELHRDAPKERVRDVPSYLEQKTTSKESPTTQAQQRQLAIDRYRKAVRERKERTEGKEVTPNRDGIGNTDGIARDDVHAEPVTNASPFQSAPSSYAESKPIRNVEQPSSRSEAMRLRENTHVPQGIRERRSIKEANRTVSGMEKSSKATVKTAGKSIKTAERSIKTTEQGVKTGAKTVEKTAEATAKTAQKTAQAAAKTAEATAKAAQTAAKTAQAATHAAKVAVQAVANAIKAIIAAIKSLIAAIAAGGWVAVLIIAIVAIIAVVLCLCFGVFSSNDANEGRPMTEAIQEINSDFVSSIDAKINRFKRRYKPDEVILVYEGDTDSNGSVMNWQDVLGIYAVSTTTDPETPTDVLTVTRDKIEILRSIFKRMNSVSYDTELETEKIPSVDGHGDPIYDDEGNPVTEEKKTLTITITVSSMDYRDAAEVYDFTDDQKEMLREMMRPEYYPLFAELTGDVIGDGGEYGFGLDINPDLPPNELGYQIVQAAKRYIGRSYASMDCSTLCRTAYRDCGLNSMNGLSSVRMAQKCLEMGCLFTDASQLQAGDLIFFASLDPSRGPDYCRDRRRCGDGKCRRWLHIHHVAIYINDQYLIDSTGGDNSVQIRKLYGQNTKTLKWVCFGRPTT